jgi:hypothetical protein
MPESVRVPGGISNSFSRHAGSRVQDRLQSSAPCLPLPNLLRTLAVVRLNNAPSCGVCPQSNYRRVR